MKTVSVVVPTYNQAKYVEATLDHVLHQDYPSLEVVICDDGSTDGTADVLQEYVRRVRTDQASFASRVSDDGTVERVWHVRYPQDRKLRLLLSERNVGATANYNRGFSAATGDYCTFIPGDDLPHPQMISALALALEERDADFAYSDMFVVDDAGRVLRKFELPDYSFERCFADWYLCGVSKLFRRALLRVGLFDSAYRVANDYDLFSRFAMAGARFVHVSQVLYSVRFHGDDRKVGQHSPENERLMVEESRRIAERCREFLGLPVKRDC